MIRIFRGGGEFEPQTQFPVAFILCTMLSIATCLQTLVHFPGLKARDHLKCVCDGAFERLLALGRGVIWGLPWVLLKLRFDQYIMTTYFVASDAFALVLTSQQHSLLSSTMATYRCPEVLSFWRGVTG